MKARATLAVFAAMVLGLASPGLAQVTGTVAGSVKDAQGGVVPIDRRFRALSRRRSASRFRVLREGVRNRVNIVSGVESQLNRSAVLV
jgi:hypothetical protein